MKRLSVIFIVAFCCFIINAAEKTPIVTKVIKTETGYKLIRDGKNYSIKGGGGSESRDILVKCGGNSFRTWGSDNLDKELDDAANKGLSVTIGIWLGHKEHGFSYINLDQVVNQYKMAKAAIDKYKNHPALLIWGIGNEMEGFEKGDNPAVWMAVELIAAYAKKVDPNHPTMTVISEIGGERIKSINALCPSIDIIGINTYAGGQSIPERYKKAGGVKPYIITEFGPGGTWEMGKNDFGIVEELTSTEKAKWYRATQEKAVIGNPDFALGSYCFAWGHKQEATATWYGMFLPDGSRLAAVDTMQELWSGLKPANLCPELKSIKLDNDQVEQEALIKAIADGVDPEGAKVEYKWELHRDSGNDNVGGATQAATEQFPDSLIKAEDNAIQVKMPKYPGVYRLYVYLKDDKGNSAVGNKAILVKGKFVPSPNNAKKAIFPVNIYSEGMNNIPFYDSGWMGDMANLEVKPNSTENPHSGNFCYRISYKSDTGWAGIYWQNPANNWGTVKGGLNMAGAAKLSVWARGEVGGEEIEIAYGGINKLKADGTSNVSYDSSKGTLGTLKLSNDWKEYTLDLSKKDMSCIISGLVIVMKNKKAVVYLDDINYIGDNNAVITTPVVTNPVTPSVNDINAQKMPFKVYADNLTPWPFFDSGWMGDAGNLSVDPKSVDAPHEGNTCYKISYKANNGWAGIFWQSPANNWGNMEGGYNLIGAKKLTFWAKGEKGGEEINIAYGGIENGNDKKSYDTSKGELKALKLTGDWKVYSIDLSKKDMSNIISGFVFSLPGKQQVIYLDDIQYE